MAKLGGEQTELLQISGDERARAARTALLFTEEELTRNLQIVLRTFDDLNYRQEQRFHLELGLLKLIHAQRLLPIEELLSGVAAGARPAGPPVSGSLSAPRPTTSQTRPTASSAPPVAPSLSPFGTTGASWSTGSKGSEPHGSGPVMDFAPKPASTNLPTATMERAAPTASSSSFANVTPFPAAPQAAGHIENPTEGALAKAPQVDAPPNIESIRHAVGCALAEGGHVSAAQLLGAGAWTLDGAGLRIEVAGMGKKMIALTINAAAEKIIRQELKRLGVPTRFMVVPGEGAVSPVPLPTPMGGSIQEAALANPLVQRAREIFKAEVRSVVDLRQK
jgi:DNA polymerase-3 subunit gamma/tau